MLQEPRPIVLARLVYFGYELFETVQLDPANPTSAEIVKSVRRLTRLFKEELRPFGLSPVEAQIVIELSARGPRTVGRLGQQIGLSGSTLTGALDRLEKRELLRREPVPGDRRAMRLVATAWNATKRARLIDTVQRIDDQFFAALTARERDQLHRLLCKLNGARDE